MGESAQVFLQSMVLGGKRRAQHIFFVFQAHKKLFSINNILYWYKITFANKPPNSETFSASGLESNVWVVTCKLFDQDGDQLKKDVM